MPTSDSNQIPAVLQLAAECKPKSILDIGMGWGRYGTLLRLGLESGYPNISDRNRWQIRIDGIESFDDYIGNIQRAVYDRIVVAKAEDAMNELGDYDLILMNDVIEHFEKSEAQRLVDLALAKCNHRLLISTPNGHYEQGASFGNELERHLSSWSTSDFTRHPNHEIYANKKSIIAVIDKNPTEHPGRRWKLGALRRYPCTARLAAWIKYRKQRLVG